MTKARFELFDTLQRTTRPFQPIRDDEVKIYTCGPTVYGDQHVGNYRSFVVEDVLVRTLRRFGFAVTWVMNITDVGHLVGDGDEGEDKLVVGAKREGITAWDVARRYEARFLEDLRSLRVALPDRIVRATETVDAQIKLIQELEEKGLTYVTADGVYFDSVKIADYGKLARLDIEGLQAGARVDIGEKHHLTDFALWKFSPKSGTGKRDMEWPSPWGIGFPGWHIECSAIIKSTLGDSIDIHAGGIDAIPVHHTNEIAQSEAVTGKPLANYWFHINFLTVDGGKMAKSLGNLYTIADVQNRGFDTAALRLFYYSAHYHSTLNYTWEGVEAADKSVQKLRRFYQEGAPSQQTTELVWEALESFDAALSRDLNMPEVIAALWKGLERMNPGEKSAYLQEVDTVLGLGLREPPRKEYIEIPEDVAQLRIERDKARMAKDWAESDRLRLLIEEKGFQVKDTQAGTELIATPKGGRP